MNTRRLIWMCILAIAVPLATACVPASQSRSNQSAPALKPPAPVYMDASKALGLWHSNFGPVKIEPDDTGGERALMGVWVYDRGDQEVIGFFKGALRGNVLEFSWSEPAQPQDLTGSGFLSFEAEGTRFSGRWWTSDRTREGVWSGWRGEHDAAEQGQDSQYGGQGHGGGQYGGQGYGGGQYGGQGYGGAVPDGAVPADDAGSADGTSAGSD